MGVVINFRKDELSADDVLRYFFHEFNEKYNLNLTLTDPRLEPHLTALRSLADVYICTAMKNVDGIPENLQKPLAKELNHLRARFLAETVLGVLSREGLVHVVEPES